MIVGRKRMRRYGGIQPSVRSLVPTGQVGPDQSNRWVISQVGPADRPPDGEKSSAMNKEDAETRGVISVKKQKQRVWLTGRRSCFFNSVTVLPVMAAGHEPMPGHESGPSVPSLSSSAGGTTGRPS